MKKTKGERTLPSPVGKPTPIFMPLSILSHFYLPELLSAEGYPVECRVLSTGVLF